MKHIPLKPIVYLVVAIFFITNCKKDDDDAVVEAQIVLSPGELKFNDNEPAKLYLSVQPASEFQWNISSKPDWLEINPSSGTVNSGIVELTVTAKSESLDEGTFNGNIEIISNGAGKAVTAVEMAVNAHPVAEVTPESLSFSEAEYQKNLTIKNVGKGFLIWNMEPQVEWLNFNTSSGYLGEGQEVEIMAWVSRDGLPMGTEQGQALLESNADEGDLSINVTLEVPGISILSTFPDSLTFDYFDDEKVFYLKNSGNISSSWTIDNSNDYLVPETNSGTLEPGDSILINLGIDRTMLESQVYEAEITFENAEGLPCSMLVKVENYKEEKWLIDGEVIDAEFDRNSNSMIAVFDFPYQLRKYNMESESEEIVDLNLPPQCVSVSLDGNYAVVGHNAYFSYVNLNSMQLVENFAVTCDAFDIILAPNNWVYVFPEEDQWERIRCVDLSTGSETLHTGSSIYDRTRVKLHPSGDYIYGANNGLSPSDFEKYDITNGTAEFLYDSPYHGDYSFGGDIWISDEGTRLFARSRNVFNSSTSQSIDMTYSGELAGEDGVITLDYSSNAGYVYTVFSDGNYWSSTPGTEVRKYETNYLAFQGVIPIPGFLIPDGLGGGVFYNGLGYFGFFNDAGTNYHMLIKAEEGTGSLNNWAIATIVVE